jgi:hypothetical protein
MSGPTYRSTPSGRLGGTAANDMPPSCRNAALERSDAGKCRPWQEGAGVTGRNRAGAPIRFRGGIPAQRAARKTGRARIYVIE